MKRLIPMNEHGLFAGADFVARVDSRYVADAFDMRHEDVVKTIDRITGEEFGFSPEFRQRNFTLSKNRGHLMTRDGFAAFARAVAGRKTAAAREAYVEYFNSMEQFIRLVQCFLDMHPRLIEAIRSTRDDSQVRDCLEEWDMLNILTHGMTAEQFREDCSIPRAEPLIPHLGEDEKELMEMLQITDVGLQYAMPDIQQRKRTLEYCAMKWEAEREQRNENKT